MASFDPYQDPSEQDGVMGPNAKRLLQQMTVPPLTTAEVPAPTGAGGTAGPGPDERPTPYEEGGVTGGTTSTPVDTGGVTVDRSKWNTKGFATPQYTATNFGEAQSGWDPTKWNDPNAQQPKYVIGRILKEASGGTGFLKDPAQRAAAEAAIMKAYPGAKMVSKDHVLLPGDTIPIDIYRAASSGEYGMAFAPDEPAGASVSAGGGGRSSTVPSSANGIPDLLSGDPLAAIRTALSQYAAPSARIQALLGQLRG